MLYGLLGGLGSYVGIAAGRYETVGTAIPYGVFAAVTIALARSVGVAYRNGRPRRWKGYGPLSHLRRR